jgi:ParB family transcriptional regulator, chromosome partitioning protein
MGKLSLSGGLGELLDSNSVSDSAAVQAETLDINCSLIDDHPNQPRTSFVLADYEQLKASIGASGVQIPITVRHGKPGRYTLIAGQCRLQATRELGVKSIPAVVRSIDEETGHLISLIENAVRSSVPVLQEASALRFMLSEYKWTQARLAGSLGKSKKWVSEMVALGDLPNSIVAAVNNNLVSQMSQLTQLRLAYAQDSEKVDKFLSKQKQSVTFKAAKALYDSCVNEKPVKPKRKELDATAIAERLALAKQQLVGDDSLNSKQTDALHILETAAQFEIDDKDRLKLMVLALFPSK